jgi:hypothetical protein
VQREFVRILDNFTGVAAELAAEACSGACSAKKTYEHYRYKLLTFTDCASKPFGGIASIVRGITSSNP